MNACYSRRYPRLQWLRVTGEKIIKAPRHQGRATLAATDIGHRGGHHGHELDIGLEREVGHIEDGVGYMANVYARLRHDSAVSLWNSGLHALAHFGGGIAYIDLSAGDVVFAAVQRDRFGESGDRVFGGRIRSR